MVPSWPRCLLNNAFLNFEASLLRFKLKMTLENGGNLHANMDNHVGFIPNIFHSIFGMIRVRVNDTRVTPSNDLYGYKAYFDDLFSKTKENEFMKQLSGGDFNAGPEDEFGADNPHWVARATLCNRSRVVEYSGKLSLDF